MENERTFGDVFRDNLDIALTAAIADRFAERTSERSEGPTELANPQTVTQPVNPSQTPGGQPVHNVAGFAMNPAMLAVAGVGLLVVGLVLAKVLR